MVSTHYVVLTIKSANGSGDHAVAISPLAGEHATYVVRSDCTEAHWMTLLAQSKPDAREQGARKFLFTGSDAYSGMRAKVVDALECPPRGFLNQTAAAQDPRTGSPALWSAPEVSAPRDEVICGLHFLVSSLIARYPSSRRPGSLYLHP